MAAPPEHNQNFLEVIAQNFGWVVAGIGFFITGGRYQQRFTQVETTQTKQEEKMEALRKLMDDRHDKMMETIMDTNNKVSEIRADLRHLVDKK